MNEKFFEQSEERQSAIVNGALKQFAVMGYKKASMQDIALECGVSKALLFHYFESKRNLFAYIYEYSFNLSAKSLASFEYRKDEDLFEMIYRSNLIKLDLFKAFPYLYKFIYKSYFEQDPEVQTLVKNKSADYMVRSMPNVVDYMDKSKLREGITPEKALQIILWVSEGFLQKKLDANDYDPDMLLRDFNEWMDTLKLCLYNR